MLVERFFGRLFLIGAIFGTFLLATYLSLEPKPAEAQERKKQAGDPFLMVFSLERSMQDWWIAEYDHPAKWMETAWRREFATTGNSGLRLNLRPTQEENIVTADTFKDNSKALIETGKTTKKFLGGQVQRRKWYGYGRYEVVMQPASGYGLISGFYLYTGPIFGDTHEEIDIEFLGRDTGKIQLNRYRDGNPLGEPVWVDLGFDAHERPRLYAFEWSEETLTWYIGDREIFRLSGADEIPKPPGKIYMDLWAGGLRQADWSGEASDTATGETLILCASFSPPDRDTAQCSDLVNES